MVVACLLAGPSAELPGQVQFAGPADDGGVVQSSPVRVNPFRTPMNARQVQFQELPPQVPSAEQEAAMPGSVGSNRSVSGETVYGLETIPPGSAEYDFDMSLTGPDGVAMYGGEFMHVPLEEGLIEDPAATVYSTNEWFRRGYWYSQQDIVVLLRTDVKNVWMSADQSVLQMADRPVLSSKSVAPTYAPGTRLTLGRFLGQDVANRDFTVEFGFLGLFDYTEEATLTGALATALGQNNEFQFLLGVTGPGVPGYSAINDQMEHRMLYSTDLNSVEANLRILGRPLRDRLALQPNGSWVRYGTPSHLLSFLMGFRGVSINELFRYDSRSVNIDTDSGNYLVQTRNDMFGIQIGTDLIENYTNWSWGGRFKAAGLYNFADRRSSLQLTIDNDQIVDNFEKLDKQNLAVLVEGGLMATYQLRANMSVRLAYDAMYVTGFGVAPENMEIAETFPRFEVTGDAIYHGMSAGFEMLW